MTRVLYPDDSTQQGRALRLIQEYFLVACSLAISFAGSASRTRTGGRSLESRHSAQRHASGSHWPVANDAHPARSRRALGWDELGPRAADPRLHQPHPAPEALERWPAQWLDILIPRQLEIIFEINRRFIDDVHAVSRRQRPRGPRQPGRGRGRRGFIRMANLAIVGSHSTNGVAAIHPFCARPPCATSPRRFRPLPWSTRQRRHARRWLRLANPSLARVISAAIGNSWIADLTRLRKLRPLALSNDAALRRNFKAEETHGQGESQNCRSSIFGIVVNPDTI